MLMSMVRKQLYIDDDLNAGLKMLAARSGMSEAEHVRAALRAYLDSGLATMADDDDPLLAMIGLVDDADGPTDVAENHDDYLYGSKRPA